MANVVDKWLAVDVDCDYELAEAIEGALDTLDPLGIETDLLAKKKDAAIRVTAYFEELPPPEEIDRAFEELSRMHTIAISTREVEQTDWLAEWKKHWRPTEIGKFVIAPPWEDVADGKIVIKIEPGMAFGTGTHATTQLCLAAISDEYVSGESFLDVGCGTGILSIAAAKLNDSGSERPSIFGCDTDEKSVEIALENAGLNGVADSVRFDNAPIDEATAEFDLVCANVTLDVILPMLDLLISKAKHTLVLSGILVSQTDEIENALRERGFADCVVATSGEWISVLVKV